MITGALRAQTILAGHSAGGFAITAAAERDPSRVAGLISLSACIPATGLILADLRRAGPSQLLRGALILSDDPGSPNGRPGRRAPAVLP